MQTNSWSFAVPQLDGPVGVRRWGHYGMPVVLFASAGGDSFEPERLQLLGALGGLIDAGRIKLYAVEGTAIRMMLAGPADAGQRAQALRAFDQWVGSALVRQVREDCQSEALELLAAGCAYGAASAVQALLLAPRVFRGAIGLSGTYDLRPWIESAAQAADVSALQSGASAAGRTVLLAYTQGDYEDVPASQQMAVRLRALGVTVKEDIARSGLHFGFAAWREQLPRCVGQWL